MTDDSKGSSAIAREIWTHTLNYCCCNSCMRAERKKRTQNAEVDNTNWLVVSPLTPKWMPTGNSIQSDLHSAEISRLNWVLSFHRCHRVSQPGTLRLLPHSSRYTWGELHTREQRLKARCLAREMEVFTSTGEKHRWGRKGLRDPWQELTLPFAAGHKAILCSKDAKLAATRPAMGTNSLFSSRLQPETMLFCLQHDSTAHNTPTHMFSG